MIIEIPNGSKSMTLPNGMEVQIPEGAKTMEVPDELFSNHEQPPQQVPQAQNPIAQQTHEAKLPPQEEPKKEYGVLEKAWDVATNNPVANFIPSKLKEWWNDDKTINHDSKIDNDFRHTISAFSNPKDPTLTGLVGEWTGSKTLKAAGKRNYTDRDISDFRGNVVKAAGDKYDVRFDEQTNEVYARPKGSDAEFEKVLNDIGDASWDELSTRMDANLAQVGTEIGIDMAAGLAFDRKYGKHIKHPALRFVADGLVATTAAPFSSGVGSVAQTAYSGEEISTKRLWEKTKEEALDNTLATAAAMTGIGLISLGVRAVGKVNPIHGVKGGKDEYLEKSLNEAPAKPDYLKAEDISLNPIKTAKNMEERYRAETKVRDDKLALIAKQKAEAEDIYKDFGGVREHAEVVEMAGQSNAKEILGNHFNHSQRRVNAEVKNSLKLTQNFKTAFKLGNKTSADLYRFMRGGMQRVKDFYTSYYGEAQNVLLEEMGDDIVKVSSQTQTRLNELIHEAKHPLNVENTKLSTAQKSEFDKDYQELLDLTKRDFTKDVPVWNEKKEAFEYVARDTESYTLKGLFDVQKKFNAFLYKHKDKFTKPQKDNLDTIKEAIYADVHRAIDTREMSDAIKYEMKELWSDANKGYSNYKELTRRSDVLAKLVEDDVPFDVSKFASDVFKNINKRDAGDFDILYTFGKEIKKTGGDLDEFYSSVIDGLLSGAKDIKSPTGEISQGVMRTVKHQNQSLEIMDFDAFHKAFNSIDETTLKKIFGLSPRGEKILHHLKRFDDLASRESVLQQTLLNKEFKMSETAMQQHDQGKLFYSFAYGAKAMLWDSWAKYVMKNKAYEDFFLRAITKERYEDIEPLIKKLASDQREVPPIQRVDIDSLRADLKAAKEIAEQTAEKLKEIEAQTGKSSTTQEVEDVTISGLLEYRAAKDPSIRDFDVERVHAKELAAAEGMDENRIARINSFDDLGREIRDFKLERNEITMAHRRNPPPKGSEEAYKIMDDIVSQNAPSKTEHQDIDMQNQINASAQEAMSDAAKIMDGLQNPRGDKFSVIDALKTPKVVVRNYMGKRKPAGEITYGKKADYFKQQEGTTDHQIEFSDVDFDRYFKVASEMMPTFQGAKKEMATVVPQVIERLFTKSEREQIDTLWDYFGGGGSWGLFMSKIDMFPNIKNINIVEYSPARKQKIEFTHNHHREIVGFYESRKFHKLVNEIIKTEKEMGNAASGTRIAKQLLDVAMEFKEQFSDVEIAALYNTMDYMVASFGAKEGSDAIARNLIKTTSGIGKAVDDLKAKGVRINYLQADSYALEHQAGSNVLALMDPPYLKTKGYAYVDFDTGDIIDGSTVGMDIYTKTWQMYGKLKELGNSVIYTDEAYYKKALMKDYVQEDQVIDEFNKNAFEMTEDISKKSDVFMEVPVDDRIETLGIIKSDQFKKGTGDDNTRGTEKNVDGAGDSGESGINSRRTDDDTGAGRHQDMDSRAAQETSQATQSSARVDADDTGKQSRAAADELKQPEIDYAQTAQRLNENPPSLEELKALTALVGNPNFTAQVFMALRQSAAGKPNKMNGMGAKLYSEALEKYKDILPREIDKVKHPITKDNLTKLHRLRGYFRHMKESGQIKDGFASVTNPQSFKAMMSDLESGNKIFRNSEYEDMYYELQKLYDELADRIEPLYHTKPKETNTSHMEKPDGMSDEEWSEANLLFSKGVDNLAVGAYAGIEEDEDGNYTFNPEKFILGLGGYTAAKAAAKQIIKHYKIDDKLAKQLDDFARSVNEDMAKMAGGGTPPKSFIDDHGFYSVLEKTIDEKVGGRIDTASLSKMLEKNGVKQDELEWSGLKELMENNEKLTKEQIEQTIKENRLELEVVEKRNKKTFTYNEKVDIRETLAFKKFGKTYDELTQEQQREAEHAMFDYVKKHNEKAINTKYAQYKLNGGENYREMLFTMPQEGKGYKSNHWDEKNILVFTRADDRTIDGKDTLFIEELQSDWHQEGRKKGYGKKIPDAPFKKNWHELGLKRMMQEAVTNGYDKIAWTTGKQQADRYSLEKTVDTVVYNKDAGVIQATNGGKEVFFKQVASEKEIEEIMGKELTSRLLDKKNTTTESVHVLQGKELKFGGEGMQGFYDEIMPSAAKKLFKKWGVKPKMEELDDVEQMVWSVDITPQMREDIKNYGQPLYARGSEELLGGTIAGIEYDEDGNISGIDVEKFIAGAAGGHALSRALKKEKRGIFNVTHNGKNSTQIKKYDLEALNDYIKYERGLENPVTKKGYGAVHIEKHLKDGSNGKVSDQELLKMGEIIRDNDYTIKDSKRVYERYENDVRFRVVVGDDKNGERIISFYSNRKKDGLRK